MSLIGELLQAKRSFLNKKPIESLKKELRRKDKALADLLRW